MKLIKIVVLIILLSSSRTYAEEKMLFKDLENGTVIEVIDLHGGINYEYLEKMDMEVLDKELIKFDTNDLKLQEGMSGENIYRIKYFLKEMGYIKDIGDYYFDNKLKDIIVKYQSNNSLNPDGIVGASTYKMINRDLELNHIYIAEIEINLPADAPSGQWIIINKTSNTLIYLNKGNVLNKFPIATGKTPSHTPEGKYSIITKLVNPNWGGAGIYAPIKGGAPNNPLGKRWMGLNIDGGGSYGIHGNSNIGSVGKYVSLGCIRMFNEDVESFYEIINKGCPVWIGSESKLLEYGISWRKPK